MKKLQVINYRNQKYEDVDLDSSPDEILNDIVTYYGKDLRNFARYLCGNEADAEDAYQNALLSAHRYIDTFRGEAPLKNWLLKLVSTAVIQKKRGRKNDPRLHTPIDEKLHPELEKHLLSHEIPADIQAMMKEDTGCLMEALETITEEDREMLLMHHGDDVLLADIAKDFKMTVSGVKTRLFRARLAVRKFMEEKMGDEPERLDNLERISCRAKYRARYIESSGGNRASA